MSNSRYLANFCREAPDKFKKNYHVTMRSVNPPLYYIPTGLSKEIWNFFEENKQPLDEFYKKMDLWKRLNEHLNKISYNYRGLFVVGSTFNGFGLKNCDLDFIYLSSKDQGTNRYEAETELKQLSSKLRAYSYAEWIRCIIDATVPLIKFEDRLSNVEVDITHSLTMNIMNTYLLHQYSQVDWRVKPLMIVIKKWAKVHGVINSRYGTLSSYAMILMVIHFLQCGVKISILPCLQEIFKDKFPKDRDFTKIDFFEILNPDSMFNSFNDQSLGELLLEFFKYYSEFKFQDYIISIREGRRFLKSDYHMQYSVRQSYESYILIEDPFTLKNVAYTVSKIANFDKIKSTFSQTYLILKNTNNLQIILYNCSSV